LAGKPSGEVWDTFGLRGFRSNADARANHGLWVSGAFVASSFLDDDEPWYGETASVGTDTIALSVDGHTYTISLRPPAGGGGGEADDEIISPMPGKVISLDVRQGDAVKRGQKLLTLEAMKMEHSLTAPFDGIVAELNAAEGAQVSEGALLARIEKEGE
jgi:3-methylcrotonyl-CoA carboxylase alpha subunit